ncbi:MAG TPA: DUF885 domain-containing protein [Gammaproteobacteria bacterium]|jgi:uncharacterized protein (DUF885 family)|nr:DUF885 domain-containing protein [Gammaproteobacteria bacterium]HIB75834.1 DUF885 domain-containing protein [Gammaproteobacteria bacterium]HIG50422.1 DUF885 domain-containing protein [Gammaproteobacteria bacterium]HIO04956.1 DUF885 domain-containing protein [Gammaproteobacteria bacterium]
MIDSPESLTYLGVVDRFNWLTNHQSKISITGLSDMEEDLADAKKLKALLLSYKNESLSEQQKITKEIAVFDASNFIKETEEFPFHNYPLNQIGGIHLNAVEFMTDVHPIRNVKEAEAYIDRLNLFDDSFEATLEILNAQKKAGIFPPKFVFDHLIRQLEEFLNFKENENPLRSVFLRKIEDLNLDSEVSGDLISKLDNSIENSVTPGFKLLYDFVKETRKKANQYHGVWSLPNGDEFYALRLKVYTTTDYSAEDIHNIGLSEVERITKRMQEIAFDLGYGDQVKVGQLMNSLNEDSNFLYSDTPDRKERVVADYNSIVEETWNISELYFHNMPKSRVEVRAVPEYSEQNQAGGYYMSPALDGSRPGVFYANLYDIKQTPTYSMRTLAFHEAIPGHHLQVALNLENESLSLYRRFGYGTSAFSEGWALYAERLALEAGLAEDPYDELGVLQSELFRAVRLVVDTGIHYKRWSREEAMAYMKNVTGMSDTEVRVEIERYIVWPGQACSYKVGMLKILELREKAKEKLGEDFNIKDFHSVILEQGQPPLFIVEDLVNLMLDN